MRTLAFRRALAPAVIVLGCSTTTVHADPSGRYSWDQCDPVVTNKNWTGPGTYVQVISALGLVPGITSIQVRVVTGYVQDAWYFSDNFVAGCQPQSRLAFSSTGTDCAAAPVTQFVYQRMYTLTPSGSNGFMLDMALNPNFAPDPAVRYAIARLAFDHSHSVAGYAPPVSGNCGSADVEVCFAISGFYFTGPPSGGSLPFDSDYLTWQDFNATHTSRPCPAAVPARPATWGQIKGQYR